MTRLKLNRTDTGVTALNGRLNQRECSGTMLLRLGHGEFDACLNHCLEWSPENWRIELAKFLSKRPLQNDSAWKTVWCVGRSAVRQHGTNGGWLSLFFIFVIEWSLSKQSFFTRVSFTYLREQRRDKCLSKGERLSMRKNCLFNNVSKAGNVWVVNDTSSEMNTWNCKIRIKLTLKFLSFHCIRIQVVILSLKYSQQKIF